MDGKHSTLDLGLVGALALGVEGGVVDQGQVGVLISRVADLPEGDLCVVDLGESAGDDIAGVLLGGSNGGAGERQRSRSETHLDRNE